MTVGFLLLKLLNRCWLPLITFNFLFWLLHSSCHQRRSTSLDMPTKGKDKEFPLDIIYQILLSLSVKTLTQFCSVCKQWYSLISNLQFQHDHYSRSQQNPFLLTVKRRDDRLCMSTYCNKNKDLSLVKEICVTVPNLKESIFHTIQSCRGLVCLAPITKSVLLYNPSTDEKIALPQTEGHNYCIGFGYAASIQKFKVVKFYNYPKRNSKGCCKVFTLGDDDWREANSPPLGICFGDAPFIRGSLHLLHQKVGCYSITAFNIETETYNEIQVPMSPNILALKELGGSLCLMEKNYHKFHVSLWILKHYNHGEWVKEWNIDFSLGSSYVIRYWCVDPISILGDGSILVHYAVGWQSADTSNSREWRNLDALLSYNPKDKNFTRKSNDFSGAAFYVESFQKLKSR